MKLKNRRMLSFLLAIVMVLTMLPFQPLKVRAAGTSTLDLGTPVRSSATNYQLSNAAFGSTGVVDAGGGYFKVAVNNGSTAVGTFPNGITELTNGIFISGVRTDQSTSTNRVFNFSGTTTHEDIQALIRNMTFTQDAGQTQSITVNIVPGAPLENGKTSVRTYNGRHFIYVARLGTTMTFYEAVTTAANVTNNNGHLVEPTATTAGAADMFAIASMFKEFKSTQAWNGMYFLSFIGATKTTAPTWATSSPSLTRYVSNTNGPATGLESTPEYYSNNAYDHLTLLLDTNNNKVRYLGVNNTHGGSSIYLDPGIIVEYNSGVINIITATKDVPSFSGVGIANVTAAVYKSVTTSVYNGSSTITATPLDPSTVMSVTYNGDPVTGLRAFDQSGNELTADANGWYSNNGSPIVFLPFIPGETYTVAAAATFDASSVTPKIATTTQSITLPPVDGNFATGRDLGHPGQTTITVDPSSTLAKYAIADAQGNVVSDWKTGNGSDLTFDNLYPLTNYQIVVIPADQTPLPATGVSGTSVTTPHNAILKDVTVNDISRVAAGGSDSITVKPTVAGQDYAIFDTSVTPNTLVGSWVPATDTSGVTFSGLDPAKTYQVVTRLTDTTTPVSDGITAVPLSMISATGSVDKSTGDGVITVAPVDPTKQYSLLNSDGTIVAGVAAYDQNGTALTASNGWYHTSTSIIVFKPVVPGGTYKVVTNSNTSTSPDKVAPRQSVAIPVIGDNLTTGLDPANAGKTSITVNPSSTLAKYAVADENGNVVSGWKTGTGSDLTFDNLNPGTRYQIVTVPADTTDPLPTANVSGTRVLTPVAQVDANNILRMPTSNAGSDLIHINNTAPAIQYALVDKSRGQYVDVNGNLSSEPVWTSGNGSTLTYQPVDAAKTYQVLTQPIPVAGAISPMPTSTDVLPYDTVNLSGGILYEVTTYPTQATITVAGVTGSVYQYTGKYAVNGVPVGVYPASITITNPKNASLNATFTAVATVDDNGNVTFGPFTPNAGAPAGMSVTSDEAGTIIVHPSTAVSHVASDMTAAILTNTIEALQAAHNEFTALTPEEQLQISRATVENVSNAILNLLQASLKVSSAVSGVADPATTRNQLDNQKGMLLTPAEIAQALSGQSLNVTLNLNATDVSNSTTPGVSVDKSLIETLAAPSAANIGFMYDINITKKVDVLDNSGEVTTEGNPQPVPVVPEPISITLNIPTNLLGYQYFAIARVHGGIAEFIPSSVNGTTVTFSSTKFSTYALVYSNQMIFADNLPGKGPYDDGDNGNGGGGGFISSTVTIDNVAGGKVTVDNSSATSGTKVTITVTPDAGYSLDKLVITDDKGNVINYTDNGNGTYTYVQPNGTAKIKATFKALDKAPAPATDTGVFKLLNTKEHLVYLSGYEDGTFRSDTSVTRAEVAQMFYNLLKNQNVNTSGMHFVDVPENAWYAKAVNTLASLGIINGYENGAFAPDKAITRAEFTIIAVSFSNKTAGSKSFADVSNTHWAYSNIATSVEYGWVNGYPDGTFEPDKTITRAESATIVNRMLNRQPDRKAIDASTSIKVFKDVSNGYWAYYDIMEATNAHQYEKSNGMEIWVP